MSFRPGLVSSVLWIYFVWLTVLFRVGASKHSGWSVFAFGAGVAPLAAMALLAKLTSKHGLRSLTDVKLTRGKAAVWGITAIFWFIEYVVVWKYWPKVLQGSDTGAMSLIVIALPLLIVVTVLEYLWAV